MKLVLFFLLVVIGFQNCGPSFNLNSSIEEPSLSESYDQSQVGAKIPEPLNQTALNSSDLFGLKGDCQSDDTQALQNFFNRGGILKKPIGGCYLIQDTIYVPSNIQVQGEGVETLIKLQVPMNSAARPVLDLSGSGNQTTINVHISNLSIDAGGDRMTKLPSKFNGNIGYGGAIIVQSSDSSVSDIKVKNAWDCGISFYQLGCLDGGPGQQCNGFPKNVTASRVTCENNGIGQLSGFGGSCVGVLTAKNALISDSVDYGSAVGFHLDYGGSAQAEFKNLKAYNNRLHGYWIGSAQGYFENIEAYNTLANHPLQHYMAGHALILDRFASARGYAGQIPQIGIIKNFKSIGAQKSGMVVAASGWKIENPLIISSNQSNQNYSAILGLGNSLVVTGLSLGVTNTDIINPTIKNDNQYPYQAEYEYDEEIHENSCITMNIKGGEFFTSKGKYSPQVGSRPCSNQTVDIKKIEAIIVNIFLEILKREPLQEGLDYYVKQYLSGKSMVDIKFDIIASDEGQCVQSAGIFNISTKVCTCPVDKIFVGKRCEIMVVDYESIVKKAFQDILGRQPLQTGLDYYVNLLKSGYPEASLRAEISASDESQCIQSAGTFDLAKLACICPAEKALVGKRCEARVTD